MTIFDTLFILPQKNIVRNGDYVVSLVLCNHGFKWIFHISSINKLGKFYNPILSRHTISMPALRLKGDSLFVANM